MLEGADLCAFVRDGAVLPRASGDVDTPMLGHDVVKFRCVCLCVCVCVSVCVCVCVCVCECVSVCV